MADDRTCIVLNKLLLFASLVFHIFLCLYEITAFRDSENKIRFQIGGGNKFHHPVHFYKTLSEQCPYVLHGNFRS